MFLTSLSGVRYTQIKRRIKLGRASLALPQTRRTKRLEGYEPFKMPDFSLDLPIYLSNVRDIIGHINHPEKSDNKLCPLLMEWISMGSNIRLHVLHAL